MAKPKGKQIKKQGLERRFDAIVQKGLDNVLIDYDYLSQMYWCFNCYKDKSIEIAIQTLEELSEGYYENNPLKERGGEDKECEGNPAYEAVKLMYEIGKAAKELAEILQEEEK